LFSIISCSPEKKLAKKFVVSKDTINVLLLIPDVIYEKNLNYNTDSFAETIRNSVSISNSLILKNLNDSTVMNLIISGITDGLNSRKIKIYTEDNMSSFMLLKSNAYIFNLAQTEIDEYTLPYTTSQVYGTSTYTQDFDLNALSMHLWIEVSELNTEQDKSKVLYSTDNISDKIIGNFRKDFFSNEIRYVYNRHNIVVDDAYNLASDFGSMNADYIFDYFLNEFIYKNYSGKRKPIYMHYNYKSGKISQAGISRFIFM
jgi:hypothetical protein